MNYGQYLTTEVPQTSPVPDKNMVQNNAGGFVFSIDKWKKLERFLILGSEGGTYYASERSLTTSNIDTVLDCIKEDGKRVVNTILQMRDSNRVPKMSTLIFALAACSKRGDKETRFFANNSVKDICWNSTQLFEWIKYIRCFGGFSSGQVRAITQWYKNKSGKSLALQLIKYRQRNDCTHVDALKICHLKPDNEEQKQIYGWLFGKEITGDYDSTRLLKAFDQCINSKNETEIIDLINKCDLPWECVPTDNLTSNDVNLKIIEKMPMIALLRHLGRMSSLDIFGEMSSAAHLVAEKISSSENIEKSKVHPIQVLSALNTYKNGQGYKGSKKWTVNSSILSALDKAFYLSFKNVLSSNKRIYFALDVSGSMSSGTIAGVPGLTPKVASSAMAMVSVKIEPFSYIAGFSTSMVPLEKNFRNKDLTSIIDNMERIPFGSTNCSLPMLDAIEKKMNVDAFVIYTDNETWHGGIHPFKALQKYRSFSGINSKLIVVGMTSTGFSIADPEDEGMLDVVGFDTSTPQLITEFCMS